MRLLLVPTTSELERSRELALAVQQLRDAARRIAKKTNLQRERTRFTLACSQIESMVLGQESIGSAGAVLHVGGQDIDSILEVPPAVGDIRLPYMSADEVRSCADLNFRKICDQANLQSGLVAMLEPYVNGGSAEEDGPPEYDIKDTPPVAPDYSGCATNVDELSPSGAAWHTHKQIRNALETGRPIGWINMEEDERGRLARHEVLVEALRDYIATPASSDGSAQGPAHIRVAYPDGSIGDPVPLLCLKRTEPPKDLTQINVALISARHFELDEAVEVALMRNAEISGDDGKTIADQERFAFEKAKRFLESSLGKLGGVEVHLFHTGLEPAVVGTYRAIIDFLCEPGNRGKLNTVPRVPSRSGYKSLRSWY